MKKILTSDIVFLLLWILFNTSEADKPCIPRKYKYNAIVCVCNATYCDEISKIKPIPKGQYVVYTSSIKGERFQKREARFGNKPKSELSSRTINNWLFNIFNVFAPDNITIQIKRKTQYQTIHGFGGSFTDATGINIRRLSREAQNRFIDTYFGEEGLEYNIGRVPIGGTDFSPRAYAYNMEPANDIKLSNFSLTVEDFDYKMPIIKEARAKATDELLLIASSWSPPNWMKTNHEYAGAGFIYKKYYQTWADYHLKFLEEYSKAGIKFWSITTGNEPAYGLIPFHNFNCLGWMPPDQGLWVGKHFGPTIKKSFPEILILGLDDTRINLPWWITWMAENKDAMKYIDGISTHWYTNDLIGPTSLDTTHEMLPDKFIISTESSIGGRPWLREQLENRTWTRAEMYLTDIIESLNHWTTGWVDWNLGLDIDGSPNWAKNKADTPIVILPKKDEFIKQPLFYAVGHFSKFVPRGSKRIEILKVRGDIESIAFLRPDDGITVVLFNRFDENKFVNLHDNKRGYIDITLEPHSVQTIVYW